MNVVMHMNEVANGTKRVVGDGTQMRYKAGPHSGLLFAKSLQVSIEKYVPPKSDGYPRLNAKREL